MRCFDRWTKSTAGLELFPIRWDHLIDQEMRRNNEIERRFLSYLIGIHCRVIYVVPHSYRSPCRPGTRL